jgi:cytochrome b6-f complex iron-sulfur subunit
MCDCNRSRRKFLTRAATLAAGSAMGGLVVGCGAPSARHLLEPGEERRIELALSEVPALAQVGGSISTSTAPGGPRIILVRRSETEVIAVSPICPHQGCTVNYTGEMDANCFVCPCHGSAFGVEGDLRRGPATTGLTRYPTLMTNENLLVTL